MALLYIYIEGKLYILKKREGKKLPYSSFFPILSLLVSLFPSFISFFQSEVKLFTFKRKGGEGSGVDVDVDMVDRRHMCTQKGIGETRSGRLFRMGFVLFCFVFIFVLHIYISLCNKVFYSRGKEQCPLLFANSSHLHLCRDQNPPEKADVHERLGVYSSSSNTP